MIVSAGNVTVFLGVNHIAIGQIIDSRFGTGNKLPLVISNTEFFGVRFKYRWRIVPEVNAVRKKFYTLIAFILFVYFQQITLHGGANAGTVRKEKICDINAVLKLLVVDEHTVLV